MGRQLPSKKRMVIDLTGSDDDDASLVYQPSQGSSHRSQATGRFQADDYCDTQARKRAKLPLRFSQQGQSQHRPLPWETSQDSGYRSQSQSFTQSSQYQDYDEDDADQMVPSTQDIGIRAMETFEKYGTMETKVVGLRYYKGIASFGERVSLNREPRNQWDANAIRVDNVQRQQVGHLPATVAARLAKYIDQDLLVVEAILAGDSRTSRFDVPVDLWLFGTNEAVGKERLKAMMKQDRLPTNIQDQRDQLEQRRKRVQSAKAAADEARLANASSQQWQVDLNTAAGPEQSPLPLGPTMEELMQDSQAFNPREISEYADRFGIDEEALKKLPKAGQPKRIVTELLPYQRQGLAWLVEKENLQLPAQNSANIVQLWKRSPYNEFTNIATNYTQKEQPKLASGGILADDMGLGKTLQIISLISADIEASKLKSGHDKAATLIVAPVSVMSNWRDQIFQHVDSKKPLNVFIYHGPNRPKINSAYLKDNKIDVMITTYGTLSTEYMPGKLNKYQAPKPVPRPSGLFSINWRRVVLDEGHGVRNPTTKGALAATAVMARSRWVLTGTPIINSLKDLYSILRFVGITGGLERLEYFNSLLIRPMGKSRDANDPAVGLLQALIRTFSLRRKKEMTFIDLKLPELTEYIHRVKFTKAEEKRYLALQAEAQGMLRTYDRHRENEQGARARDAYSHLLEVLLRLRQVCNHWKLCQKRMESILGALEPEETLELTPENRQALQRELHVRINNREECPICYEELMGHEPVITHCGHVFVKACIARAIQGQAKCPLCRAELPDETKLVEPAAEMEESLDGPNDAVEIAQDDAEANNESSKVTAALEILNASHKKPNPKIVIFSQWSSFLTLLQPHLDRKGYKYARIDGSMSAIARDTALHALSEDDDTTILLASLGCCAVGLNLVAANTVIMCDSWWAPAIEDQAVDRVHRLGQKRDCTVWRLVIDETIEQKVLDIQAEKRKLMAAAFSEKEGKRGKARERMGDIRRLLE